MADFVNSSYAMETGHFILFQLLSVCSIDWEGKIIMDDGLLSMCIILLVVLP
jgi:hypothetical protein